MTWNSNVVGSLLLCCSLTPMGCAESGALDQISITPECSAGDVVCVRAGIGSPIAVGASLPLVLDLQFRGSAAPSLTLSAAAPEVLDVNERTVSGRAPGVSALLVTTPDGRVVDFVHFFVEPPDRLEPELVSVDGTTRAPITDRVELLVGESMTTTARILAASEPLAGNAETTWTASSDSVSILTDGLPTERRIHATAPGTATITASALGLNTTFEVEVRP